MNLTDIAGIRLISQQIAETNFSNLKDIVGWMGAMQAQDFAMIKWAIGVRLPNSTEKIVETAINNGEVIRTHLLRPTWHIVSSDDIYWILDLTAYKIKASLKSRHNGLELTEKVLSKSNSIIEKALSERDYLSREELVTKLKNAKISISENRASHLLFHAELDGIACSGPIKNGKQTYALLEKRVPRTKYFSKEEALANLAKKYFSSRCPATVQDFIWWSGLSVSDAKRAFEMIKDDFISETIGSQTYLLSNSFFSPVREKESIYLLPAFDEYIISYKDRSASLPFENHKKAVSNNGIFRPIIVINGQVTGIWKRTITKDKVIVETKLFEQQNKATIKLIEKASLHFGQFLEKKVEVDTNQPG